MSCSMFERFPKRKPRLKLTNTKTDYQFTSDMNNFGETFDSTFSNVGIVESLSIQIQELQIQRASYGWGAEIGIG